MSNTASWGLENGEAEILTIPALVIPFGRFTTSRANNPTWPSRCLFLHQNAANLRKFRNTSSKSTRMLAKHPPSAIPTFMSDLDLNSPNERRSSGRALPTMATLLHSNLYMLPHSALFGLLLHFLKPGLPGCDSGTHVIELRRWLSDKATLSYICSQSLILALYKKLGTNMYYFVRIIRCTRANSLTGPIVMRTPQ